MGGLGLDFSEVSSCWPLGPPNIQNMTFLGLKLAPNSPHQKLRRPFSPPNGAPAPARIPAPPAAARSSARQKPSVAPSEGAAVSMAPGELSQLPPDPVVSAGLGECGNQRPNLVLEVIPVVRLQNGPWFLKLFQSFADRTSKTGSAAEPNTEAPNAEQSAGPEPSQPRRPSKDSDFLCAT